METSKLLAYMGYVLTVFIVVAGFLMDKSLGAEHFGFPIICLLFAIYLEVAKEKKG